MQKNLEKITSGVDYPEQSCIICQERIKAGDEVVRCPRCHSIHHADCWKNKGGCGKTGCPQIAKAVVGPPPQGDGPPPPLPRKYIWGGIALAAVLILIAVFWPKPPDPALGRDKVVVLGESYFELSNIMSELADEFNENNSEIYIDLQLLPVGAMDTKLMVLIAAGEAPDVFTLRKERLSFFLEQDTLMALGVEENGTEIYGIEHPAQQAYFVAWRESKHPEAALAVLHYFVENIPPLAEELLWETEAPPLIFN
ncbi:MAG TPA: hypothetical protein GX528_01080 [Firmicutes bacterium]|nr:hypothetical protein [Bacillota bacterium]